MTKIDNGRRGNRVPPLALIVIGLLALLAIIVLVGREGSVKSPDTDVSMPIQTPDEAVMPTPQPNAPVVPRPS
jgi:hypothetical protein